MIGVTEVFEKCQSFPVGEARYYSVIPYSPRCHLHEGGDPFCHNTKKGLI
jgi:hypothetical protein